MGKVRRMPIEDKVNSYRIQLTVRVTGVELSADEALRVAMNEYHKIENGTRTLTDVHVNLERQSGMGVNDEIPPMQSQIW